MNSWLLVLLATIVLLGVLSRVSLYIELQFCRHNEDDYAAVTVHALQNLFMYTMKIPAIKLIKHQELPWVTSVIKSPQEAAPTHVSREQRFIRRLLKILIHNPERFSRLLKSARRFLQSYRSYIDRLAQGIHCERLDLKVVYGFEDAAFTGLMMGVFGSLTNLMLMSLHNRVILDAAPAVTIKPLYGKNYFELELKCIFRIRVGNVITATIATLKNSLHREATRSG